MGHGPLDKGGSVHADDGAEAALGEVARILYEFSDPGVAMRRITEETLRAIPSADGAAVELVDGGDLRCVCATGICEGLIGMRFPIDGSLSGLAVQLGATLRSHDAEKDPRIDREGRRVAGAASLICVPLHYSGGTAGAVNVASTQPYAFSDRDVATLAGLSSFMTAVVTAAQALNEAAGDVVSATRRSSGTEAALDPAVISNFVANVLRPGVLSDLQAAKRVEAVLANRLFDIVYQPIVRVCDGSVAMVEALSRFTPQPYRAPDAWFADAWQAGFGTELELAAAEAAARQLHAIPPDVRLAVNISPQLISHPKLVSFFHRIGGDRFVIELTEHVAIHDYPKVREALQYVRDLGVQLAIDDTGAGFASLSHIIKLAPDVIKLDRELIHGIDVDPVRRSLASSLVSFGKDIGAEVVAEGIETADEFNTVRHLGVALAQGYLLGRPTGLEALSRPTRRQLRPVAVRD